MPDGKWKVIASPYQGYNSPGKILDGQISTFYSPNQGPKALQWVQVDFVDVVMVSGLLDSLNLKFHLPDKGG